MHHLLGGKFKRTNSDYHSRAVDSVKTSWPYLQYLLLRWKHKSKSVSRTIILVAGLSIEDMWFES